MRRIFLGFIVVASGLAILGYRAIFARPKPTADARWAAPGKADATNYRPWRNFDLSGYLAATKYIKNWPENATLQQVAESWRDLAPQLVGQMNRYLADPGLSNAQRLEVLVEKATIESFQSRPDEAYRSLEEAKTLALAHPELKSEWLYTLIYAQGVMGLRIGEDENCILCMGESSCILPISRAAVHANPRGSELAIKRFTEYLRQFPDDLGAKWLLNLANMTLGRHPDGVPPEHRLSLDRFSHSEFDIGAFRDVAREVGVNRFNQAGGAIMDDFDDDGRYDIFLTSWDALESAAFYHNDGDRGFTDLTKKAGLLEELGGLNCVQADYNNDGYLDVFIPRGAWLMTPIRPSLLENRGGGVFVDVTEKAGLAAPLNSIAAQWADYDNDGFLDLFVCAERQRSRLYRNRGDGTFEEVGSRFDFSDLYDKQTKGCAWIDYDNDDYPDLFLTNLTGTGELYRNDRKGGFTRATGKLGIAGPKAGFGCWAWDYDNDGWLDLFATSYQRTLPGVVKGILGEPIDEPANRLYRNNRGERFEDKTREAGLNSIFAAMGCNFGDFDNDGYLDMYLGTGEPSIATLVPNRLFKNVAGLRFAEITGTSRTGHLQKGHGVAIGDWDRDGALDIFIETGGASPGDRYHDLLFKNPGQKNHWLSIKLIGQKSNRSAIGARIKVVTAGEKPHLVHRHVSSGSSFGANPLEQHIGLGDADRVADLEVHWPTSGRTQVFHNIPADRAIEIRELEDAYRTLERPVIKIAKPAK